jgi:hypothetical protein
MRPLCQVGGPLDVTMVTDYGDVINLSLLLYWKNVAPAGGEEHE